MFTQPIMYQAIKRHKNALQVRRVCSTVQRDVGIQLLLLLLLLLPSQCCRCAWSSAQPPPHVLSPRRLPTTARAAGIGCLSALCRAPALHMCSPSPVHCVPLQVYQDKLLKEGSVPKEQVGWRMDEHANVLAHLDMHELTEYLTVLGPKEEVGWWVGGWVGGVGGPADGDRCWSYGAR